MCTVNKKIFLSAITCPTLGWMVHSEPENKIESISDRFLKEQGLEIHQRARNLFPNGYLVYGDNISAAERTDELLKDSTTEVIFEATFLIEKYIVFGSHAVFQQLPSFGDPVFEIEHRRMVTVEDVFLEAQSQMSGLDPRYLHLKLPAKGEDIVSYDVSPSVVLVET